MSFVPSPRLAVLEATSPPIDRKVFLLKAKDLAREFHLPAIPTNSPMETAYRNTSGLELRASADHTDIYVVVYKEGTDPHAYEGLVTRVVDAFTALGMRRCFDANVPGQPSCR